MKVLLRSIFVSAILVSVPSLPAHAGTDFVPNPNAPDLHIKTWKASQPITTDVANAKSPSLLKATQQERPPDCDELAGIVDACLDQILVPGNDPVDPTEPARAELTRGRLITAVRDIRFPALKINIQPGGTTLINLDTIFYAQPRPFSRSITLLDYDIDITATPTAFTWNHGDNTSHTTQSPGAPYPSKDVVYRYQHKAQDLHPSVDVTYKVRYRVDNGPWQDLGQTLTATGPTGTLDAKEATAVLTKY